MKKSKLGDFYFSIEVIDEKTFDVKFDEVAPKCSYITPVPGGGSSMMIISLNC